MRLGELCLGGGQYGTSERADATQNTGIPVLGMSNIFEGRLKWENLKFINLPPAELEKYRLRKGDVLFNRTNSAELVGKSAVFDGARDAVFASYLVRLKVNEEVADPHFIAAYINSEGGRRFIEANMARAIGQVNISASTLMRMPVPVAPLTEQKRIIAILNEQTELVARARAAAEAQLESIKALPAAYLRAVFSGTKVVGGGQRKRLGEILHLRKEVIHPRDNPKGSAVFVGLEHIESVTGRRLGSVKIEMSELSGRKPQFYKGDIVYGYLRPYLNKVWVADFDGLCSVDQYVYSVSNDMADTNFVAWFMRSPIYLERAPIDTTPGQLPRIRTEEVAAVEIELPSVNEQRQIASEITERMSVAHNLRQSLQDQLNSIGRLPAALLREAFDGKL